MAITTTKTVAVTGNQAVAEALRQLNPDVMPAYPITPSTGIMESFTSFVSNGKVDTETILVESEHSAMGVCIGAALSGARAYAKLLSPLVAGSLERASCLAEAMEARGFGRPGATRQPRPLWTRLDRIAVLAAATVVAGAALWR